MRWMDNSKKWATWHHLQNLKDMRNWFYLWTRRQQIVWIKKESMCMYLSTWLKSPILRHSPKFIYSNCRGSGFKNGLAYQLWWRYCQWLIDWLHKSCWWMAVLDKINCEDGWVHVWYLSGTSTYCHLHAFVFVLAIYFCLCDTIYFRSQDYEMVCV